MAGFDMNITGELNASEILEEMQLVTAAQQLPHVRSIAYCILTFISLEIISTFDKEVLFIWRRPWSLFKLLYVPCRYLSAIPALLVIIPPAPSDAYCEFYAWYLGVIGMAVTTLPGSCLLAIRLDKLFKSKIVRATLAVLVFVESASQLVVVPFILAKDTVIFASTPIGGTCTGHISSSTWLHKTLLLIPYPAIFCVYIAIALYAFIRHCREKTLLSTMRVVRKNFAPLYLLFIRDGVIYYIINFFGILCGFLLLANSTGTSVLVLAGPTIIAGVTSISCCRLVLLLHGNPEHATGVYELDTNEFYVETRY